MDSRWFKGFESDKENRRQQIRNMANAFDALDEILAQMDKDVPKPDYNLPGWSADLAEQIGRMKAIKELRNLINVRED